MLDTPMIQIVGLNSTTHQEVQNLQRVKNGKLIYTKKYFTRSHAMKDEYKLKKDYKLRNKIKFNFLKYE